MIPLRLLSEDKERREKIDVKNQLDSVIYNLEKTLKDNKDKFKEEDGQSSPREDKWRYDLFYSQPTY